MACEREQARVSNVIKNIEDSYEESFGRNPEDFDARENIALEIELNKNDILITKNALAIEKAKLSKKKTYTSKEKIRLEKALKNFEKLSKRLDVEFKTYPLKKKLMIGIRNLMLNRLEINADENTYSESFEPDVLIKSMKDILVKRHIPFNSLEQLPMAEINSMHNFIAKSFIKQDKLEHKNKRTRFSTQIKDPAMAMLDADKTMTAYRFIERSKDYIADRYAQANKYHEEISEIESLIENDAHSGTYYRVSDTAANPASRKKESVRNMVAMASDMLNGQTRYFQHQNIYNPDGSLTAEYLEDKKEYEKKLRHNLTNKVQIKDGRTIVQGIYDGGDIQKFTDPKTKKDFYYISVRAEDGNGHEYFRVYEVPTRMIEWEGDTGVKKRVPQMMFPDYIDTNEEWKKYFTSENTRGNLLSDRMDEGWYTASTYVPLEGEYKEAKTGRLKTFKTSAWNRFVKDDTVDNANDPLPDSVKDFVVQMRGFFKFAHGSAISKSISANKKRKNAITKAKQEGRVKSENIDEALEEIMGIDFYNNVFEKDGNLITVNTIMGHRDLYLPFKFNIVDTINNNLRTHEHIERGIEKIEDSINALIDDPDGDMNEVIRLNEELIKEKDILQHSQEMLEVMTGKRSSHDVNTKMSQETIFGFARHRGAASSPIANFYPNYDGIRKDMDVFYEYADELAKVTSQNELKSDLIEPMIYTKGDNTKRYLISQLKATFGQLDAGAELFFFKYGDEQLADILSKMPGVNISPEGLYFFLKSNSALVSGNLLGAGSAMNNNFQRFSIYMKANVQLQLAIDDLPQATKDMIVKKSGTDDVMQMIGDALISATGEEPSFFTGMHTKKDLALLWLTPKMFLARSLKNNGFWMRWIEKVIERGGNDANAAGRRVFMRGVYDLAHGLAEGSVNKKTEKAIISKLKRVMTTDMINTFLHWGLRGGWMYNIFKRTNLGKSFSFMESEGEMRKESSVMGALMTVAQLKNEAGWKEWEREEGKSRYEHPEVLAGARNLTNATMFGMSQQFQPLFLRGAMGQTLFKFWNYTRAEAALEWNTWRSYRDSLQKLPLNERKRIYGQIFTNDVESMHPSMQGWAKMLRTRVLVSTAVIAGQIYLPIFTEASKWGMKLGGKMLGTSFGSIRRGGSSIVADTAFRGIGLILKSFAIYGNDKDDDEYYRESMRYFLPIYMNMVIDTLWRVFLSNDEYSLSEIFSNNVTIYNKGFGNLVKEVDGLFSE